MTDRQDGRHWIVLNAARALHVLRAAEIVLRVRYMALTGDRHWAEEDETKMGICLDDIPIKSAVWDLLEGYMEKKPVQETQQIPELSANASLAWNDREVSICDAVLR